MSLALYIHGDLPYSPGQARQPAHGSCSLGILFVAVQNCRENISELRYFKELLHGLWVPSLPPLYPTPTSSVRYVSPIYKAETQKGRFAQGP